MADGHWARLTADENVNLRRGAWYRVTEVRREEVVVEVNRQQRPVPRALVEIAPALPRRWTIVPRPHDAVHIPPHWGAVYAVCPSCRHRARLKVGAASMRCQRCKGSFAVAWNDGEGATPSGRWPDVPQRHPT